MRKLTVFFSCLLFLTACQSPTINKTYQAKGQDSRVQYIIIHYTATDFKRSLNLLTTQNVSSHYLIDDKSGEVFQLVDENQRAWHAGLSDWQGKNYLNASTIGIELVNKGFSETPNGIKWYPYSKQQIQSLIRLLKQIKSKYQLSSDRIIGHSDIAPQRKSDPGPLFPWRQLAKEGLGVWPSEQAVAQQKAIFDRTGLPNTLWIQQKLAHIGYATPQTGILDKATTNVIRAFQLHYQQNHISGIPNTQTAALLSVIANKKFAIPK